MQWLIDIVQGMIDAAIAALKAWVLSYAPKARAYLATLQTIPTATWTRLNFTLKTYDTHSLFTNYRFTADRAGYYLVSLTAHIISPGANKIFNVAIYKNNNPNTVFTSHASSTALVGSTTTDIIYLEAGDYIEGYCYHTTGLDRQVLFSDAYTYIAISQLF